MGVGSITIKNTGSNEPVFLNIKVQVRAVYPA